MKLLDDIRCFILKYSQFIIIVVFFTPIVLLLTFIQIPFALFNKNNLKDLWITVFVSFLKKYLRKEI